MMISIVAEKYAYLEGERSAASDSEGVATFSNLTVVASTSEAVYIVFVVDAAVTCAWQDYAQSKLEISLGLPIYIGTIFMENGLHNVTLVTPPSTVAIEGEALAQQPRLRVLDTSGNPVSGVGCVAVLDSRNGKKYPAGYAIGKNASTDKLLNKMVAADYYSEDMVNLGNTTQMIARKTDSDGYISFSGLGFTGFGALRNSSASYGIVFRCGAGKTKVSASTVVLVSTRVASIEVLYTSTSKVTSSIRDTYDLIVTAYVKDSDGNPISGKIVTGVYVLLPSEESW